MEDIQDVEQVEADFGQIAASFLLKVRDEKNDKQ